MRIVTFGEIMLRLSPPGCQRLTQARTFEVNYGGGEANVAVSLANYGEQVEFVSRLPNNDLADACLASLHSHGISTEHIIRGGERLGNYFLEVGAAQRASKVIYDRAGSSFATIQPGMVDWKAVFSGADWFHWTGITPAVSQNAAETCREAIIAAREMGVTVSCDLNYRTKLWKWGKPAGEVMGDLVSRCQVLLGNEEDAEKVFGIRAGGIDPTTGEVASDLYRSVCTELADCFPSLLFIAITLRGSRSASHNTWSSVLWSRAEYLQQRRAPFFTAPTYDIFPVVDRVGSGDAFMGGLIYGFRKFTGDPQRVVNFATAAGCLKHSIPGDFNAVSVSEVEQLMAGDSSGRVSR